jgi:hypothetical protein
MWKGAKALGWPAAMGRDKVVTRREIAKTNKKE